MTALLANPAATVCLSLLVSFVFALLAAFATRAWQFGNPVLHVDEEFYLLVADRMLVQGYHYAFPSAAYIEKDGNGYRHNPIVWQPML